MFANWIARALCAICLVVLLAAAIAWCMWKRTA